LGRALPLVLRYHHYVFELYALSKTLDLPADATRAQLLDAMKDIIIGKAAYVGRFPSTAGSHAEDAGQHLDARIQYC
jgi:phosphatidylethanolamine-binding protein (PEBP) family uncharacterized protein